MQFNQFKTAVQRQFNQMKETNLYRSSFDKDKLWELYLSSFPEGTNPVFRERTEHDCQCCRQFIRNAGTMVTIVNNKLVSIWDVQVGGFYQVVADALAEAIRSAPIDNVFYHYENQVGTDKNYQQTEAGVLTWEHFHVHLPAKVVCLKANLGETLGQYQAKKDVLQRGLQEITIDAIDTVLELIEQNSLYRGAEHKTTIVKFLDIKRAFDTALDKELFCWHHVKQTSQSTTHIRNSVIGTLLTDLSEGKEIEQAVRSFEVKVAPSNYQRPTALVTKAMVDKARQQIEELGLTSALERRYAVIEDITINNVLFADRSVRPVLTRGVFDEIQTVPSKGEKSWNKVEEVSVEQFLQQILPTATSLEVMVENKHAGNLVSLIAPCDLTAPNLFKWGNPFSWSYQGEMADSIKERVKAAGGNIEAELRCSLSWFNYDDLDLHMVEPNGYEIYYPRKGRISMCGGVLDVDMNAGGSTTRTPVENICYSSKKRMRPGMYRLFVHQFQQRESDNVGFEVEIELDGKTQILSYDKRVSGVVPVATIVVAEDGKITIEPKLPASTVSKEVWGLSTQTFHKVSTVMLSPNYWDGQAVGNKHLFFMLEGCRNEGKARGFFNEFLSSDLAKHRKVMELVGAKMRTEESDHQLSGLGFSSTQRSSVLCKVSGSFTRVIRINF